MAVEITSNTVVKILVRRGEEAERTQTLLANGELGYSQDIGRLFVGDGFTLGGRPVGNVFYGFVPGPGSFDEIAQTGDLIYDTSENTLLARDIDTWRSVNIKLSEQSFETRGGLWYINQDIFGEDDGKFSPFVYSPLGQENRSLSRDTNKIDFNKRFMSLSASDDYTSFYFGDWGTKTVKNNFDATVNVADRLYIANTETNPYQLQLHSRTNGVGQLTATRGRLDIKAPDEVNIFTKNGPEERQQLRLWNGDFVKIVPKNIYNSGSPVPNNDIAGFTIFRDNSVFEENVTVTGNLSVYGDFSYFETVVSVTSALSVVNDNPQFVGPMLYVAQRNNANRQLIASFNGNPRVTRPYLSIADGSDDYGPFVGINANPSYRGAGQLPTANLVVSGSVAFGYVNSSITEDYFRVNAGNKGIFLNTTGAFNSRISETYSLEADQQHTSRATYFQVFAKDTTSPNTDVPAFRINTGIARSAKSGLSIYATDTENKIQLFPSITTGTGNPVRNVLAKTNDACILFGENQADTTRGMVIGPWASGFARGLRITGTGGIGIGLADPTTLLDVNGTGKFRDTLTVTAGGVNVTGTSTFGDAVTVGGSITTTGNSTFNSQITVSSGGINVTGASTFNNAVGITGDLTVTGNIRATSDVVAFHSSDIRLKDNISTIASALEKVNQISGVEFSWNEEKQSAYNGRDVGVIAQEIEKVLPEIVTTRDDGYKAVKYEKIIPLLIEAIKELNNKIK